MNFTGANTLYTPRVSQATYLFRNIVVDSNDLYHVHTFHYLPYQSTINSTGALFHLQSGKILDPSGRFVSTYNTGESFSLSGWLDFRTAYRYLQLGDILSRTPETGATSGLLGYISIVCPSSGSLSCDISLGSSRITNAIGFGSFTINQNVTGYISSSIGEYVTNDKFQFYQSYEALLTGYPLLAFLDDRVGPTAITYEDNDTSNQNNSFTFNYQFDTSHGLIIQESTVHRTGLYNSGIAQIVDLNTQTGFSGLFGGIWSGNQFIYQDTPNSLTFSYLLTLSDSQGNPYPKSGRYRFSIPQSGKSMPAEYITGFRLTASGQYLNPPLIAVTGYYYSTGIQQSIGSLLFSSGCSGDLDITFSSINSIGTGASGKLLTSLTQFNGVYFGGSKYFRTVYAYSTVNVGTGYTIAPRAHVNTGAYGVNCYDVPLASGYNQAWFTTFNTSGTIDVQAGWFTGVALYTTGIVSGGLTGFIVTGIDVFNIGTGYNSGMPPLMSFVRTGTDSLTSNASGIFYVNTGSINDVSTWTVEAGVAGTTLNTGNFGGVVAMNDNNSLLSIKLTISGSDITVPITGLLTIDMANYTILPSVSTPFSYSKYFDISSDALKKKDNEFLKFETTSDLSFTISQTDLDTLYNSAGYTNNTWPYDIGDFDF